MPSHYTRSAYAIEINTKLYTVIPMFTDNQKIKKGKESDNWSVRTLEYHVLMSRDLIGIDD